jgi:hypothetical protein
VEVTVLVLADSGLPSVVMAGDPGPNVMAVAVSHDLRTLPRAPPAPGRLVDGKSQATKAEARNLAVSASMSSSTVVPTEYSVPVVAVVVAGQRLLRSRPG